MENNFRDARREVPVCLSTCLVGLVLSSANLVNFEKAKSESIVSSKNIPVIDNLKIPAYFPECYAIKPEEDKLILHWKDLPYYRI